jgi:tetratricopeptide (TPR) repeat protein
VADGMVEVDLYLKYGLEEKAQEKLVELAQLEPGELDVHQRLRDIHWRRGERDAWVAEQLCIARLFLDSQSPQEALRAFEAILEVDAENQDALDGVQQLRPAPAIETVTELPSEPVADSYSEGLVLEPTAMSAPTPSAPMGEEVEEGLRRALENADQMIAQGQQAQAVDLLNEMQIRYPSASQIAERLERLGAQPVQEMNHGELDLASMGDVLQTSQPVMSDEVLGADPSEEGTEDFQELKEEVGGMEFNVASSIAGFEDVESSELADIVKEFKSGVAEKLDESDFETHYNLGVAYKEMGLVEEALQEFQKAARFPEKSRTAFTSISMIYRELGNFTEARSSLRLALSVPSNSPEDRAAILYELGVLAEHEQDWEGALNSYEKAAAIDPAHRDITKRIEHLRARLGD